MAESSTAPQPSHHTTGPQQQNSTSEASSGSRNRRRGRVRGGGQHHQDGHSSQAQESDRRVNGGRQFGGQLTRLHGNAPEFVPASLPPSASSRPTQPARPKQQARKQQAAKGTAPPATNPKNVPRQRRASLLRSKAADIATRTHEDIAHGIYECAICTNEISRNSKVWSCRTCWTVFHIGCIKKWSKNEGSAVAHQQVPEGEALPAKQWRCPGCNLPKDVLPSNYSCWCEKEVDPKSIPGVPPHSCGQSCGRSREFPKACPHPCELTCHAGPCPPCTHMGPEQSCFCGKESARRRCVETDYESGWSCEKPCGDLMPCGEHTCPRPCHEGLCGECEIIVDARCYCGKVENEIPCKDREEEKQSHDWIGVFDCHQTCDNNMDCGIHHCEKQCHPQDQYTPHCPKSPDMISQCPCGKTALSDLTASPRTACTDPIPNCDKPCEKPLACGHPCPQICHSGDCLACLLNVKISCRCGRNTFNTICHQGKEELPQCMRICKAILNCGRHECGERCCTGERKALERQATKRKLKPLGATARMIDDGIEAEHICTRVCGRTLKCSNHTCQELCHKGPCNSCREAIFEDISCNCGRTTLQAPLPCGTQPPPCTFPCRRPKTCGHPQVAHNCHPDTEACPSCPFLVEKPCMCGKKVLKNQPCFRADVPCGLVCGKRLKCGSHTCQKLCHRPGECEDATLPCQQQCGKPKKTCGHPCEKTCHAPSACKEDKPCPSKIIITCDCQRRKEEVRCNARSGNATPSNRNSSLKCDDECARLIRNAQLAHALNIPDNHQDDHVPYSSTTLSLYSTLDTTFIHDQEKTIRIFAADEDEKRLRFVPMRSGQRAFIHALADDFGLDSESVDPEPHRHVVLFKTPKFVSAPMKTLAQAARIRRVQHNITVPEKVASSTAETTRADEAHPPINGYLLAKPRFALTIEEVSTHLSKLPTSIKFTIQFLTQRDVIALYASHPSLLTAPKELENNILRLRPLMEGELVKKHNIGETLLLCSFDPTSLTTTTTSTDPIILYEQDPSTASSTSTTGTATGALGGGWSQVAAKSSTSTGTSTPRRAPQAKGITAVGERPVYTVLGSKLAEYKKKKAQEEAMKRKSAEVENWEDEVDEENGGEGEEERKVEQGQDGEELGGDGHGQAEEESAQVTVAE